MARKLKKQKAVYKPNKNLKNIFLIIVIILAVVFVLYMVFYPGDGKQYFGEDEKQGFLRNLFSIERNECETNLDCLHDELKRYCINGECSGCTKFWGCNDDEVCNLNSGICIKIECRKNKDCNIYTDKPVCNTFLGKCIGCIVDSDCKFNDLVCNRERGNCVICNTNEDCENNPNGPICDHGIIPSCIQCKKDSDCGPGKICLTFVCADKTTST